MGFEIGGRKIGAGHPLFFIAEAGVNHNGSIEYGKQLIDIAAEAGADAVKFQTFKAENIVTRDAPKSTYHVETTGSSTGQSWYELLKTQEMSYDMHVELMACCERKGILFLSTPYDEESLDMLVELSAPALKIASTDTSNIPFLEKVAARRLPVILSTAMCTMDDVERAVEVFQSARHEHFAVLQCTGNYPSSIEASDLNVIKTYRERFGCPVGYSDHTLESINPVAATALGADIYEKHFTIDRSLPGPDHRMSLTPDELKDTISAIRLTEKALGSHEKRVHDEESENRIKLRKSVVSVTEIPRGCVISDDMVAIKRPATGIDPHKIGAVTGCRAKIDIPADTPIEPSMIHERK